MATEPLPPPVRSALRAVARHGLAGDGDGPPPGALDDGDWRRLVAAVREERLTGLLDRAVADGALAATPAQAEEAEERAAGFLRGTLRLERALVDVAACLGHGGVPFLVLKGPAVARLDEPDAALRHYVDLDLLVAGADLDSAVSSLAALGYRRDLPERRAGFDRRFAKEISLASPRAPEVDVHRTLVLGAFGLRLDLGAFWASPAPFSVGGAALAALDAEGRFAHACLNAVLGDEHPRLLALRDVARISTAHRLRPERLGRLLPPGRAAPRRRRSRRRPCRVGGNGWHCGPTAPRAAPTPWSCCPACWASPGRTGSTTSGACSAPTPATWRRAAGPAGPASGAPASGR